MDSYDERIFWTEDPAEHEETFNGKEVRHLLRDVMHEFGHGPGLCDLYRENQDDCTPTVEKDYVFDDAYLMAEAGVTGAAPNYEIPPADAAYLRQVYRADLYPQD